MTPQEIHTLLKKVLDNLGEDNLGEIDDSETFTQMLADNSFLVDGDDMGCLVHQVESMLAAVSTFIKTNA